MSLANSDAGDPGPTIAFLTPRDGQTSALSTLVDLQVASPGGVQDVSLSCNGLLIQYWQGQVTFQALVDLTPCSRGIGQVNTDAGPIAPILLTAVAHDLAGVQGPPTTIHLNLDLSTPVITLHAPLRVAPQSTLTFSLDSSLPLAAPPSVAVGGAPAAVTGAGPSYSVTFSPTPALGIDTYDGGLGDAGVPIELLQAVEAPLLITVDARGTNGNLTHLNYQILLSRIVWDQAVPGIISVPPDAGFQPSGGINVACPGDPTPVAASAGLQLPLVTNTIFANTHACVGGFMSALDGTFVPAPAAVIDAGTSLMAFDGNGRGLYFVSTTNTAVMVQSDTGALSQSVPLLLDVAGTNGFARPGSALCQPQSTCGTSNLVCVAPATGAQTYPVVPAVPFGLQATTGDAYFSVNSCVCGGVCALGVVGPLSALVPWSVPALSPNWVMPIDAGFILGTTLAITARVDQLIGVLSTDGGLTTPVYFNASNTVPASLVGTFPDGRIVTWRQDINDTVFEGWDPGATTPVASARIPGPVQPAPLAFPWASDPDLVTPDNMAVVVNTNPAAAPTSPNASVGVLTFDHALRPRWLYRYPSTPSTPASVRLVGEPGGTLLYLVDLANERVVAMRR